MKEILDKKMQLVNKYRFNFTDYTDVLRAIYHQGSGVNDWFHFLMILDTITLFIISQIIFLCIVLVCMGIYVLHSLDNHIFEQYLPPSFLQWIHKGVLFDDDVLIILLPAQLQEIEYIDNSLCDLIESLTVEDVMNGKGIDIHTLKMLWDHVQIITNQLHVNKQCTRLQRSIQKIQDFMSLMGVKT